MSVIPDELEGLYRDWFSVHNDEYDLSTNKGCGQLVEDWILFCQDIGHEEVGHLKKTGSGTQYNGHAHDGFLYRKGDPTLYRFVDIISNAEAKPPYSSSNPEPNASWGIDIPRYEDKDWYLIDGEEPIPEPGNTVPYVPYNEQGFERCKKMIQHDYERRPQGPDYDVSVWAARFFHNHYMGPEGIPLNEDAALARVKQELCDSLKIPNDGYLGG